MVSSISSSSIIYHDGPWRHGDVHANGIRFHIVEVVHATGDQSTYTQQPLMLFLHGFGSFWWSWRHQLAGISHGRLVAIDLRGYGGTDKPPRGYDGWTLASDTAGLIRALGHSSAILVGHGIGGLLCWATALLHPQLIRGIGLISAPHPVALRSSALGQFAQARALLPGLFGDQFPLWPEYCLRRSHGYKIEKLVKARAGSRWQTTSDYYRNIEYLRHAIQIPAVAHCALEYHRWAIRSQFRLDGYRFRHELMNRRVSVPLLHIHGSDDRYILADAIQRTRTYAPDGHYMTIPSVGHFAHEEAPDVVNEQLEQFFIQTSSRTPE